MSRTDLIADGLTMIRNAFRANKINVLIPYSNVMASVVNILKQDSYIENFKEVDLGKIKEIKVYLKYEAKKSVLTQIKKISTPGRRIYVDKNHLPSVLSGYGIAIISTSKGIMNSKKAKEVGIGGEVICYVW